MELWKQINIDVLVKNVDVGNVYMKYKTPADLWRAACQYFEYIDTHNWKRAEWKEGKVRKMEVKRPYTLQGLQIYLGVSHSFFRTMKSVNKHDVDNTNRAYIDVVEQIEKVIFDQQYTGAASGFFNANIVARALGLADKVDTNNTNANSVPMTKDEMIQYAKELQNEV